MIKKLQVDKFRVFFFFSKKCQVKPNSVPQKAKKLYHYRRGFHRNDKKRWEAHVALSYDVDFCLIGVESISSSKSGERIFVIITFHITI